MDDLRGLLTPGGTADFGSATEFINRSSGTKDLLTDFPAMNRRAIFFRPYGTKRSGAKLVSMRIPDSIQGWSN
jgi:hypothetical protein